LFRQQLGRRHQRGLATIDHGEQRRHRRDHGLATAYVSKGFCWLFVQGSLYQEWLLI